VNLVLVDAIRKGASDIHVEPYEKDFRVRFRIDGVLYDVMKPPMKLKNAIISRLKIMAALDISERRLPQDGRIKIKTNGKEMDFRVSVCPTLFGEKVVLRLLDKSNLQLDMTKLGFDPEPLRWFKEAIDRPYGMVLVTGPTGSGKTTTLYSALTLLNTADVNISTAGGSGGVQLRRHQPGADARRHRPELRRALRSFLRQDPDIIMIGEIRDFETAEIGVKAALTGHLVLSTLHTNDAPGTVSRLLNMGIEPFLVTASLNLILAQRLARKLCPAVQARLEDGGGAGAPRRWRSAGQDRHLHRLREGGLPRVQRPRLPRPRRDLRGHALLGRPQGAGDQRRLGGELKQEAIRLGMQTLRMAALGKMMAGMTTLERWWATPRRTASRKNRAVANLHQLLKAMVEKNASDLHITTGSPPQLRIDGELVPLKAAPLSPVETKQICYSVSPTRRRPSSRRTTSSTSRSA
jgi:type IV pilus assembly protein PilB